MATTSAPIDATFLVALVAETNAGNDVVRHEEVAYPVVVHGDRCKVQQRHLAATTQRRRRSRHLCN